MRNHTEPKTHIMDVLKLKEYCEEKSTVPADDHKTFIAFYMFEGDTFNASNSHLCRLSPAKGNTIVPSKFQIFALVFLYNRRRERGNPPLCYNLDHKETLAQVCSYISLHSHLRKIINGRPAKTYFISYF